jgi:hypothetical protein
MKEESLRSGITITGNTGTMTGIIMNTTTVAIIMTGTKHSPENIHQAAIMDCSFFICPKCK